MRRVNSVIIPVTILTFVVCLGISIWQDASVHNLAILDTDASISISAYSESFSISRRDFEASSVPPLSAMTQLLLAVLSNEIKIPEYASENTVRPARLVYGKQPLPARGDPVL